ncbi:MAG: bifunctional phosphoglucose/phosphomannose isomerase [FCB group bacterium]|nr:bifunctional phosphoglucose/phosphomannose isomerase [FCB group bacterium]
MNDSPMFGYISGFSEQLKTGFQIGKTGELPSGDFDSVILCGMGGSAIGGDLLAGYVKPEMKIPFAINRGYQLPNWVGENTLAIFSSYSGNTGETLSCFDEALAKKATCLAISSGGQLTDLCKQSSIPVMAIPGGLPPRAALGYSFAPLFAAFGRLGLLGEGEEEFMQAADYISGLTKIYADADEEIAELAGNINGKVPVFYADGYKYEAVVSRFRGQLAENAKVLASGNFFPELNHNEIVGWGGPEFTLEKFTPVFIYDDDSREEVVRQMNAAKEILMSLGIDVFGISATDGPRLTKLLALVHLADWLSYHLAVLRDVDPIPIERIDLLKSKLAES